MEREKSYTEQNKFRQLNNLTLNVNSIYQISTMFTADETPFVKCQFF